MEKPECFKWNPVFAHYKDNMPYNIPLSLQDEPYIDIFTYEIPVSYTHLTLPTSDLV